MSNALERKIVVSIGSEQTRAALLENGNPVEFHIENSGERTLAGSIIKGVVSNVLPGIQSAFVDAGLEKDIFIHVFDLVECPSEPDGRPCRDAAIEDLLHPGQEMVVQIVKDPVDTKGARGSNRITLPGRYLVLLPQGGSVGVSLRIKSEEERERIRAILEVIKPEGMGLIARTAAEDEPEEMLFEDLELLKRVWEDLQRRITDARLYSLIHRDLGMVMKLVRDLAFKDAGSVIIDSPEEYKTLRGFLCLVDPVLEESVILWDRTQPIFEAFGLCKSLSDLLEPRVLLKCGGSIIIQKTDALTAIDVNTGRFAGGKNLEDTVFSANLEAAVEIPRQIRLRNHSGLIVVDFIDMHEQAHRNEVFDLLRAELARDRIRCGASGFTRHGLVEITRKRINPPVADYISRPCPCCHGRGFDFVP